MDVLIIAGVLKSKGSQFSFKKGVHLTQDDTSMSYANLQRYFGLSSSSGPSDSYVPYWWEYISIIISPDGESSADL
jgi:hypothetical protein